MNPRVLALKYPEQLVDELKKIGVDWGGVSIMAPKGFSYIVKVQDCPSFAANILKQEMLSLGAEAAVSRDCLTGKNKTTDCLLMGNISQFDDLFSKLRHQPFGLSSLGERVKKALKSFDGHSCILNCGKKRFRLGSRTLIMGIINATPDSFSGDGISCEDPSKVLELAQRMVAGGADILDVGGESSRPGSKRINAKEELRRVVPLLKVLCKKINIPISIDTTKSEVARAALDLGVSIVNDISALRFDKELARLVAKYKAGVVLMHMKGTPHSMQRKPSYEDVMQEIFSFFSDILKKALDAGIAVDRIIIDPGIGFGKRLEDNLEILRRLPELRNFGRPILVGVSRKAFIGNLLNRDAQERTWGTAAAVSAAIAGGADIVRVHDCHAMKQVAAIADAVYKKIL